VRIVHIDTESGFRGGEQQVMLLMEQLRGRGVEQVLLAREGDELAARARDAGHEVHEVPKPSPWLPRAQRVLRDLCAPPGTIAHAHTGNAHTLAARSVRGRVPIIVTRRVDFPVKANFFSKQKYTAPGIWFVAISRAVADVLREGGVDTNRIALIHSGVDPDRFRNATGRERARAEWGIKPDEFLVGTVGAYVDHKDPLNLIEAAWRISRVENHPVAERMRFVLVGDGELRSSLEGSIAGFRIQDRVTLAGWRKDVGDCLAAFDMFVMPSKLEGLCTSLIDAQAVGLPCVATRAGGMVDIVSDMENGCLAEARNSESLAGAILRLASNEALRDRFREAGPKVVEERFTAKVMGDRYMETYAQVTAEWARR